MRRAVAASVPSVSPASAHPVRPSSKSACDATVCRSLAAVQCHNISVRQQLRQLRECFLTLSRGTRRVGLSREVGPSGTLKASVPVAAGGILAGRVRASRPVPLGVRKVRNGKLGDWIHAGKVSRDTCILRAATGGPLCFPAGYGRYVIFAIGDSHTATSTTWTPSPTRAASCSNRYRDRFSAVAFSVSKGATSLR